MTVRKRALGALAAAALITPLLPFSTAYAVPPDPPARQDTRAFCAGVPTTPNPFTDIAGNTHEENIECANAAGIALGGPEELPDSQYGPRRDVRRDQMASFIARMIDKADELDCDGNIRGLPAFDNRDGFVDVDASNTHYERITQLEDARIVLGGPEELPDEFYGPERDVRRDQMASFINRAVEFMTGAPHRTAEDYFTDDEASLHEPNINGIASVGITDGFGPDTYGPATSVPRDQMASFIIRTLADLHEKGEIVALNEDCPVDQNQAPFIEDARVATDAAQATDIADANGATGTASEGDVFEIDFSEDVATDGANATDVSFSVEDEDGDTATIVCGLEVVADDNLTSAECEFEGDVLRVTLLEDAEDENVEGNGVLEFPLTITAFDGAQDADGNEVDLTRGDNELDTDENTAETDDPSPLQP